MPLPPIDDLTVRTAAFEREPRDVREAALEWLGRVKVLLACRPWSALPSTARPLAIADVRALGKRGELEQAALIAGALAHAERQGPAAAALVQLAGARPVDPDIAPPGSLLRAMIERELDGRAVGYDHMRATIVAFHVHRLKRDARFDSALGVVLVARRRIDLQDAWWCRAWDELRVELRWPCHPEAVWEALTSASVIEDGRELLKVLSCSALDRALGRGASLGGWFMGGLRGAIDPSAPLAELSAGRMRARLFWVGIPDIEPVGALKVTFRLTVERGKRVVKREQELYCGHLVPDDLEQEAPHGPEALERVAGAFAAFKDGLARKWEALGPRVEKLMPYDLVDASLLFRAIRVWLREGPTPPRPRRVAWTEERLAHALASFRCEHTETEHVPRRTHVVDLKIGSYTVRLRVVVDDSTEIELSGDGAAFLSVVNNDPSSGPAVFAPLGDEIAFRDVAGALRELVLRSGRDLELVGDLDDEDDDDDAPREPPRVRLSELLRFGDAAGAWGLGPPTVDWRIELDFAVGESPQEIAARLREQPEERAAWERAAALYTRFIQDVLDPTFTPPAVPW